MMHALKEKLIHLSKVRIRIEVPGKKQSLEEKATALLRKGRTFCADLSRDERLLRKAEQLQTARRFISEKSRWAQAEAKKRGLAELARLKKIGHSK